jgi:hypothetical protein
MFVNVKKDGVEMKPSPSCHARFSKQQYDAIQADNLQAGDTIKLATKTTDNGYINVTAYGGKVTGVNPTPAGAATGGTQVGTSNGKFRDPDEIIMQECISNALTLTKIVGVPAKAKLPAIQTLVIDAAMEFYKMVKDPHKNMVLASDNSDVNNSSPELPEQELPEPVEA